jgi:ankyrin repeat protein
MSTQEERYGHSPLIEAAWAGHEDVVEELVKSDELDVNSQDRRGRTAPN